MSDYFVIHVGRGTDGGFGDYSPPYWSEKPVEVDGRTIWFADESEAIAAVEQLNTMARDDFYNAGHGGLYTGDFPIEYEVRRITPPKGDACLSTEAVRMVSAAHASTWRASSWGDDCCEECGGFGHAGWPDCEDDD
ncbi:hypothetical protein PBI_GAIA_116 [Mycobacterium phage Gaia]|uniref:Uncharacterized protein n=1 Tax=Mycobacterium phage Gaia TaxID=1486472 RepID=A0A068F8U6_9CAUD|nr:hypothetical protein VC46_gp117 [Mycobacterium phage Gaia]AID58935.1 hypothetical protein PBI_GAIA_116 [Mycobacterium phage Gaia]AYR00053.1 hypothetical protein PBI_NEBKISS_117 [Mycobacterium phage Nebkiss]